MAYDNWTKVHFVLDFQEEDYLELEEVLYKKMSEYNYSKDNIKRILLTGSRVYTEYGRVYHETSDLDVLISVNCSIKDKVNKFSFSYKDILITVDVRYNFVPEPEGLSWQNVYWLSYYNLLERKYVYGNRLDVYHYIVYVKRRIENDICFFCSFQNTDDIAEPREFGSLKLQYNFITINNDGDKIIKRVDRWVQFCENCQDKIGKNLYKILGG